MHIGCDIERGDMSLGNWFQPYSLPYTGTGRIEDMRGLVGLFTN